MQLSRHKTTFKKEQIGRFSAKHKRILHLLCTKVNNYCDASLSITAKMLNSEYIHSYLTNFNEVILHINNRLFYYSIYNLIWSKSVNESVFQMKLMILFWILQLFKNIIDIRCDNSNHAIEHIHLNIYSTTSLLFPIGRDPWFWILNFIVANLYT